MVFVGRVENMAWRILCFIIVLMGLMRIMDAKPRRILLDTDVNTDDLFALFYLLKQNRSEFDLKAVTVNANAWTNAGHAVNHVYDILYMMDRDDIPVGVGGDGGILPNGTILPNVGGYLPLIEQGMSTVGDCRYRQAIPIGSGGRLDIDTSYGFRRRILPQGPRKYSPLHQPTAQKVIIDTISEDCTTVFLIGAHTNFAIFLMTNPHLKKNIEHIYVMGGGVRSKNPTGSCPKNANPACAPQQCGDPGNLYTAFTTNPYAEFNIYADPFAAHQVFHSGIPITLVPLDVTNSIPITEQFSMEFERQQGTYEAQYCFQSLKMIRDIWFDDQFYKSYFMWDSFMAGVALSIMRNINNHNGENEFAEMEYMNITVVTSNEPYGVYDGSNPFFDGRVIPKFNLKKNGVHSGHVQTGVRDPFCSLKGTKKGRCEDGYTKEVTGPEAVQVLVATKAKENKDATSKLNREFFRSFLDVLNLRQQSGRFNFSTEFPFYQEALYKPDFKNRKMGKPTIFDMDMSAGDFISLIYLLKVPVEVMDLKGILVSSNGWANGATIDIVYDVLHMMGRDDIPVGLGSVTALGTSSLSCKYVNAIPHGSGGLIDSDTLFGLARDLPRSPRRYTAENSVGYGAPRNTDHPELRQPLALDVWLTISRAVNLTDKITILTNGPLTNLANIILSDKNATSVIGKVYIVGGHITEDQRDEGNIFSVPSNRYSEFNMFLDPLAAKAVLDSSLDITLIPLKAQRKVTFSRSVLENLQLSDSTPESIFAYRLLSLLQGLQQKNQLYRHMDIFLGEILGAVFLHDQFHLNTAIQEKQITILTDNVTTYGQITIDTRNGKLVNVLDNLDSEAYYTQFANLLVDKVQSAVIGSFDEQKRKWSEPFNETGQENPGKDFSVS